MAKDWKRRLGSEVRAARMRRNVTQEQLAERIERTPETISNIERGHTAPSVDTLLVLADELGFSLSDVFKAIEGRISPVAAPSPSEQRIQRILRELPEHLVIVAIEQLEVLARTSGTFKMSSRRTRK